MYLVNNEERIINIITDKMPESKITNMNFNHGSRLSKTNIETELPIKLIKTKPVKATERIAPQFKKYNRYGLKL